MNTFPSALFHPISQVVSAVFVSTKRLDPSSQTCVAVWAVWLPQFPFPDSYCLSVMGWSLCLVATLCLWAHLFLRSSPNIVALWESCIHANQLFQYSESTLGVLQLQQQFKNWKHKAVLMLSIKFCTWQNWSHLRTPITIATEKSNVR